MRYRNAVLLAALAVTVLLAPRSRTEAQVSQGDPALSIFDPLNPRALAVHTSLGAPNLFDNSTIGQAYDKIDPARSILISACGAVVCNQDYLGFASIFALAAAANKPLYGHPPDADGLYAALYRTLDRADKTLLGGFGSTLSTANFQFLALANRLDMASWDGSTWNGAELHFAYGVTPAKETAIPDFTVILEFVLAPDRMTGFDRDSFRKLAQTWAGLSSSTINQAAYPSALKAALVSSGLPFGAGDNCWIKSVRLRINRNFSGAEWQLGQMVLDPMTAPVFLPARLDDQIRMTITAAARNRLWSAAQAALQSDPGQYPIPADFLEQPLLLYSNDGSGMPMPPGLCGNGVPVRNVLANQQCSWCHTSETGTSFKQIANRSSRQSPRLSSFLQGTGNLHPKLIDLYNGNQAIAPKVRVPYQTYTGTGCTTAAPPNSLPSSVSQFHDVARRTLFVAAVLNNFVLERGRGIPVAQQFSTNSIE